MLYSHNNLVNPLQERMVKMVLNETRETRDQLDMLGHLVSTPGLNGMDIDYVYTCMHVMS